MTPFFLTPMVPALPSISHEYDDMKHIFGRGNEARHGVIFDMDQMMRKYSLTKAFSREMCPACSIKLKHWRAFHR